MNWNLICSVGLVVLIQVLAAPSSKPAGDEVDSVEQQLIRHHHSTSDDQKEPASENVGVENDDLSIMKNFEKVESESKDGGDGGVSTEDDLYDITVGDVIRDVLLTLRDHPEIVRELIASEKAKLAAQVAAFNSLVESRDSSGDTLASFLRPPEQLDTVLKTVDKKTGVSDLPAVPQRQFEEKRKEEVVDEAYTPDDSDESREFLEFMQHPQEGGKDNPMINYEKVDSGSATNADTQEQGTASAQDTASKSSDDKKENLSWLLHHGQGQEGGGLKEKRSILDTAKMIKM